MSKFKNNTRIHAVGLIQVRAPIGFLEKIILQKDLEQGQVKMSRGLDGQGLDGKY